jgi:hypothetical protein
MNAFNLSEIFEGVFRFFTSPTAGFVTSKRRRRIEVIVHVDPDGTSGLLIYVCMYHMYVFDETLYNNI